MNIKYLRKPPGQIPQTLSEIHSQYCQFHQYRCVKCQLPLVWGVSRLCKGRIIDAEVVKDDVKEVKEVILTDDSTGVTQRTFIDTGKGLKIVGHLGAVED